MTLKIGEKIKQLREAQNITQERLASYLNISYQAISKWENGLSLPDITLLPKLANFFGVTTDELLSLKAEKDDPKLKEYEEIYFDLNHKGEILEKIALARKVLDIYPKNYQWMQYLAYGLVQYCATAEQEQYSKEHGFTEEAIDLCERILEDCTIDSFRHGAIQILCHNYPKINRTDKAIELANQMPSLVLSKDILLTHIYKDEKQIEQNQLVLLDLLTLIHGEIWFLVSDDIMGKEMTIEQRISAMERLNELMQIFFQEDSNNFVFDFKFSRNYVRLSRYKCAVNDTKGAIECLLKAEQYALKFDEEMKNNEETNYQFVLLNRCKIEPGKLVTNWVGTEIESLLEQLDAPVFNVIRDMDEFIRLQKRLSDFLNSENKK